jgi:hypothetical protein
MVMEHTGSIAARSFAITFSTPSGWRPAQQASISELRAMSFSVVVFRKWTRRGRVGKTPISSSG